MDEAAQETHRKPREGKTKGILVPSLGFFYISVPPRLCVKKALRNIYEFECNLFAFAAGSARARVATFAVFAALTVLRSGFSHATAMLFLCAFAFFTSAILYVTTSNKTTHS